MELLKKMIHVLANISYVLILAYLLLVSPKIFNYTPVVILSGSMSPNYKVGTIVYYYPVESEELKIGDVIAFKFDNQIVSHRVNDIKDNLYETKGDANNTPDAKLVEYKDIVGKIAPISIPIVGYLINFINNHLYLVCGAVIILILEFAIANFNIDKKEREGEVK